MIYRSKNSKNWVASIEDFQETYFPEIEGAHCEIRTVVKRFYAPSRRLLAFYIANEIHIQTIFEQMWLPDYDFASNNLDKLFDLLIELFD